MFATSDNRNPVAVSKECKVTERPANMKNPKSTFYLGIDHTEKTRRKPKKIGSSQLLCKGGIKLSSFRKPNRET